MTEETPPTPLADRAIKRLRKVATGNGLEPMAITVLETQETLFTLNGTMDLSPLCDTETASYSGNVKGTGRKVVANAAALQEAVAKYKQEFQSNPDWIAEAVTEIKTHDSQGWGLENAKVTLPQKAVIFAATELCPNCGGRQALTCEQCLGKGTVICTQCQGQGREQCYYCGGRGENPQAPGQKCTTCNGTRFAPCRFCQTHGYLPCPTCQGKRNIPCQACQGLGKATQEIKVICGAETHFKMTSADLPSGLRRGLDRIGLANLGKGHADITAEPPPPPKEEDAMPNHSGTVPVLVYKTEIPYAEMRVSFGTRKAVVSAVGKRCALSGVPNFLDEPLKPWREKLHQSGLGLAPLNDALEAKALNEILSLTASGHDRPDDVRKLYPFGLSSEAIVSILADMRLSLKRTTLRIRTLMAVFCGAGCAALFYVWFMLGLEARLTLSLNRWAGLGADAAMLALALAASWAILNFSTRYALHRRFPKLTLALQQNIGKTGISMIGGILAVFAIVLLLTPVKPLWLAMLMH